MPVRKNQFFIWKAHTVIQLHCFIVKAFLHSAAAVWSVSARWIIGNFWRACELRLLQRCVHFLINWYRYKLIMDMVAQQDTVHNSIEILLQVFDDRIISTGLWHLQSADFKYCDYYLWAYVKGEVSWSNYHNLEELKALIARSIQSIT